MAAAFGGFADYRYGDGRARLSALENALPQSVPRLSTMRPGADQGASAPEGSLAPLNPVSASRDFATPEPTPPPPPPPPLPAAGHTHISSTWLERHGQPLMPDVKGLSAVLVDVGTGQVLWARDSERQRAPASLAKLVTAMVAADNVASLDRPVVVAPGADVKAIEQVEPASTVMGLTAGEVLTVRELLTGLFLRSGNDAAEALAQGIIPRDRFIAEMNAKARAVGMLSSHFTTPIGLDDPQMYSSAEDLAEAAFTIDTRYPALAAIADQPEMHLPQTPTHKAYDGINWLHTYFLKFPGATGMKTGYTDDAGSCVVATATRGNRRLIAVVLNSPVMVGDAEKLLDYGFALPAVA
ncbi:MAG: serine hydrolase [Candidatus Dormibacteraeota bacterium]|nr:serine hydrolase [Candidatus Dormibacteraeota bacterium]